MTAKFGAYEILHQLSSGGMGAVLLGRRRGPGAFEQLVAIKTILVEHAKSASVRAMFLDEAAILARLHHPGIATVHDFGEQDGVLYMVMEYVAGNSFRSLIDGPISPAVAARAVAEACRGVHAAHEVRDTSGAPLGLVHRDISPDNLMLGFDGHVKVIDFGIALVKNRQAPVTEFGTVKGKPPYMSPEQVKNESLDRRSDVFSLGVVLYEMLTGQPLFDGDSIYAIARAVEHQPIAPPSAIAGALPTGLDAVVMHALERDVTKRTPTAAQLAEELERVIGAAGDETLESWADRELAIARLAHRTWIAGVIAGRDAPKPVVGRATGAVTAVGAQALAALGLEPDAHAKTALPGMVADGVTDDRAGIAGRADDRAGIAGPGERAGIAGAGIAGRGADDRGGTDDRANIGADEDIDARGRRSLIVPILGALLVLTAVFVAFVVLRGNGARDVPVDAQRAMAADGVDAQIAIDADAIDPRIDAEIATDAGIAIDATPIATPIDAGPLDAGARARDAGVQHAGRDAGAPVGPGHAPVDAPIAAPIDARVEQATGTGTVNFLNPKAGGYVTVVLDDASIGSTPILNKTVSAGHHTVQFIPPVGEPTTTTFDLAPGEKKNIRP